MTTNNTDEATSSGGTPGEKDWLHLGSRYCFPFVSSPPTSANDEVEGEKQDDRKLPRREGNTQQDKDHHLGHRYAFPFLSSPPVSPTRSERRRLRRLRQRRAKKAKKTSGDASGYKHPIFPALCSPPSSPSAVLHQDNPSDSSASGGDTTRVTRKLRAPPAAQNRHPIFALSSPPTSVESREGEHETRKPKKQDAGDNHDSQVTPMRPNRHPLISMCSPPDSPQGDVGETLIAKSSRHNNFASPSSGATASNNNTNEDATPVAEEYYAACESLSSIVALYGKHDQDCRLTKDSDNDKTENGNGHTSNHQKVEFDNTAIEEPALPGQNESGKQSPAKSISSRDSNATPFPQADDDDDDNYNHKRRGDGSISSKEEEDKEKRDDDDDHGESMPKQTVEDTKKKLKGLGSNTIWHLDSDSDFEEIASESFLPLKTKQKIIHRAQSSAAKKTDSDTKKHRVDSQQETMGDFYIGDDDSDDDDFLLTVFFGKRKAPLDNSSQKQKYAKRNAVAKRGFSSDDDSGDENIFPQTKRKKSATPSIARPPPGKMQRSSSKNALHEKEPETGEETPRRNTLLLEEHPEFMDIAIQLNHPKIIPSRPKNSDKKLRR